MKRISILSLILLACGGGDNLALDASVDQTTDTAVDAPGDVVSKKDSGSDATVDATSDASDASDAQIDVADAVADAILLDAPIDVIAIDAGNVCTSNSSCSTNDFCDKGTGNCGGIGSCKPKPQFCPQLYSPVCGCDKKTYTNSCYANQAGESPAYSGVCE